MEYRDKFEKDFMTRTLKIIKSYSGSYDATLILNCLLGLLVATRETSYETLPDDPFKDNHALWGLSEKSVFIFREKNPTIKQLIRHLRNSVAHFHIEPIQGEESLVEGFKFRDYRAGFTAEIPLSELEAFVEKLSEHLENQYQG